MHLYPTFVSKIWGIALIISNIAINFAKLESWLNEKSSFRNYTHIPHCILKSKLLVWNKAQSKSVRIWAYECQSRSKCQLRQYIQFKTDDKNFCIFKLLTFNIFLITIINILFEMHTSRFLGGKISRLFINLRKKLLHNLNR